MQDRCNRWWWWEILNDAHSVCCLSCCNWTFISSRIDSDLTYFSITSVHWVMADCSSTASLWLSACHQVTMYRIQGGTIKTGPPYLIANILKISWPNCVEIGELLQYYMLNTVINFLFKNFIAQWRHLAKTQLLCDAQIYLYNAMRWWPRFFVPPYTLHQT